MDLSFLTNADSLKLAASGLALGAGRAFAVERVFLT
jgi:hypothetical protein